MTNPAMLFAVKRLRHAAVAFSAILILTPLARPIDCLADSLVIGKLPAHRKVKVAFTVKVNEDAPRTASTISNAVTLTSSNAGTFVLPALTQSLYHTPTTPTVIELPNGGATRDPRPAVGGVSEPDTTVEIFDGDTLLGSTTTDGAGNWNFVPAQALSYGYHTFKIRAVSTTAGTSEFSSTFQVKIDCPVGMYGVTCSNVCPGGAGSNACSGHGSCSDGLEGDGSCACETGHFDAACNTVSDVCTVNVSDGVNKTSEWGAVKATLKADNNVNDNPFYWVGKRWTRNEPDNFRFMTDPEGWFAISNVKSCLGYQDQKQVLYLLMQSHFPFATYYDSRLKQNYRFGRGRLSQAGVPTDRLTNVVWKMMPSSGGGIFYIVLRLQYNQGDTYKNDAFHSLELYKESSSASFSIKDFSRQSFDPRIDTFEMDLGRIISESGTNAMSDEPKPAIEAGVDFLKLLGATGWTASTPLLMQAVTQAVKENASGSIILDEIDKTGTATIASLQTEKVLKVPTLRLLQSRDGRAVLRCRAMGDIDPTEFVIRLVKLPTGKSLYYSSDDGSIVARLDRNSSYRSSCRYRTKSGARSAYSKERRFQAN